MEAIRLGGFMKTKRVSNTHLGSRSHTGFLVGLIENKLC